MNRTPWLRTAKPDKGARPGWIAIWVVLCPALAHPAEPGRFREAPMLAEMVRAGRLPPVERRLPANPPVVSPVDRIGRYGGDWRQAGVYKWDSLLGTRLGYEPLVRWDRAGRSVEPGLARSWEILEGGRLYRFHLREGIRWSDGQEFTADDFLFWYEDVALNSELSPVLPDTLMPGGNRLTFAAPDRYTLDVRCEHPCGILLEWMAYRGHWIYAPKHYLRKMHVRYVPKEALERQARAAGMDLWHQLFIDRSDMHLNPDLPTVRPWIIQVPPPETRLVAVRNPYYWKVDPAGNQLPYIDRVVTTMVQSPQLVNLRAVTGQVDMQARYIDSANYTLFMENRAAGRYRLLLDPSPNAICVYVNQCSRDADMADLLRDRRFRIALSVAINRRELIELVYGGIAEPSRAVSDPRDPFYMPWFDEKYIDYDPGQANRLLDEIGLRRGGNGMRRMPDGKPFLQALDCYQSETGTGMDLWQLVADYWREVGLDFRVKTEATNISWIRVRNGNTNFWTYNTTGVHWMTEPLWYVPLRDTSYFAPLHGRYVASGGRSGVKPTEPFERLLEWNRLMTATVGDQEARLRLGRSILSQWAEECYTIGIVRPMLITVVADRFRNMTDRHIYSYQLMAPGYIGVEQFYLEAGR